MARIEIPITECIGVAVKSGDKTGVIIYGPNSEILNFVTGDLYEYDGARFVGYSNPIEVSVSFFRSLEAHSRPVRFEKIVQRRHASRKSA